MEPSETQRLLLSSKGETDFWSREVAPTKQAVAWISKAVEGSIQWVDHCTEEQFYYFCFQKKHHWLWRTAIYGLVVISLFEVPSTCIGTVANCSSMNRQWYSSPTSILSLEVTAIISAVFYAILLGRIYARKLALGKVWVCHTWFVWKLAFTSLGFLGALAYPLSPTIYLYSTFFRPMVFLGQSEKLRQTASQILRSIPCFLDVLASLFLCVVGFTVMAMVFFRRTAEGQSDMPTWGLGIFHMWTLFTTSNSPNVFIAALNSNRFSFFFFCTYLLLTLYLLGNILLAKVYDAYKELLKVDVERHQECQAVGIHKAFEILSKDANHIHKKAWAEFFVEYCDPAIGGVQVEDPYDAHYNTWRANIVLTVFHGVSWERGMSLTQFEEVMAVFMDKRIYIPKRRPPKADKNFLELAYRQGVDVCGLTLHWDKVMDLTILVGSIFSLREVIWFCQYRSGPMFDNPTFWVMCCFSLFYAASLTLKLSIIGFERFWHRKPIQHQYDFFNVYALIISELLYFFVWRNEMMERVVIALSLARVLRLCVYITPLKHVYFMVQRLLPTYWQMFLMLCLIDWMYIVIGKVAFGGRIYNTNPVLAHGEFEKAQFWELNFNDFVGGYTTLFSLQIVNNWYVISEGYTRITGTLWSQCFFISYFVVVNLIVLNILLALILDCTALVAEEIVIEEETAKKIGDDLGGNDLEQLATGTGVHSAEFMLRKVLCTDEHFDNHYHEQHPDLPTPRSIGGHPAHPWGNDDAVHSKSTPAIQADEEYGTFSDGAVHSKSTSAIPADFARSDDSAKTRSLQLLRDIEDGRSSPSRLDIPGLQGLSPEPTEDDAKSA